MMANWPLSIRRCGTVLAGLLLLGLLTRPWGSLAGERTLAPGAALAGAAGAPVGPELGLALLGGWRTIAADFIWLRVQAAWERRDLPATQTALGLVAAIDPRPVVFWLNGARMLAYDMPEWRIEAAGGHERAPAAWKERVYHEQAQLGLEKLARARAAVGPKVDLWIEAGNIHAHKLSDWAGAAECYREAAATPGAPYFTARLCAEMLRRAGRLAEALSYLRRIHPTLPPDDEAAQADVVLGRIREWERQLQTDPARAYRPPAARE